MWRARPCLVTTWLTHSQPSSHSLLFVEACTFLSLPSTYLSNLPMFTSQLPRHRLLPCHHLTHSLTHNPLPTTFYKVKACTFLSVATYLPSCLTAYVPAYQPTYVTTSYTHPSFPIHFLEVGSLFFSFTRNPLPTTFCKVRVHTRGSHISIEKF